MSGRLGDEEDLLCGGVSGDTSVKVNDTKRCSNQY